MIYLMLFCYSWIFGLIMYNNYNYVRILNYFYLINMFLISFFILMMMNKSMFWYQLVYKFNTLNYMYISYMMGMDNISMCLMLLCAFMMVFCLLLYWYLNYQYTLYSFTLFFSLWMLMNMFGSMDLFFFFIFFEGMVMPMFFIMGMWGSSKRKIYASYLFFIYTLLGSMFVLFVMLSIFFNKGSSSFDFMINSFFYSNSLLIMMLFLFLGFGVKMPMMPLHLWLPEAHVEAPTPGSMILASILLKLGSYAMMSLLMMLFFNMSIDAIFFMLLVSLFGFSYASLVAINQMDMKKMMAYSSMAHMNFSLLGFFSESLMGLSGLYFLMFGHAITSGALFLSMGMLYDSYKTSLMFYYSSLVVFMPMFSMMMFFLILSNFGFPGTMNFVGEFLILVGAFKYSNTLIMFSSIGMMLTLIYSLSFYSKIFFGTLQMKFMSFYSECTSLEFFCLILFFLFIMIFGLFPILMFTYNISLYDMYQNMM